MRSMEFEVARGEVPSDHHRDPFYPILVFQAIIEEMPLLSADPQISRYQVEVVW